MAQDSPSDPAAAHLQARHVSDLELRLSTELKKSALVLDVLRALSAGLGLDQLLGVIMEKVTLLMEADRSTLYLLSDDGKELWSKVLQGDDFFEIRLAVGEGIAGWVAKSGDIVNIPDAYHDKRFQPAVDSRSGYRTTSILCAPMRDNQGDIVGVLQVLNKKGGPFTSSDEDLLVALSGQAAISIDNAKLYHSVVDKNVQLVRAQEQLQRKTDELNVLYEVEKLMSADFDLNRLLDQVLDLAMQAIGAEAGSIALRKGDTRQIEFLTTAGPAAEDIRGLTIPIGEGIVGWVVANDEPIIVNHPHNDDRHAEKFALELGMPPRNLACAPLRGNEIFGAIELMDKRDEQGDGRSGFSEADLQLLVLIASQIAKAIQLARERQARSKQERLASIGRMLASVLHDLKTPMTIISGYAQLMAQIEDGAQREAYVSQILRQFDFMSGMTREVLAFARGETEVLIRRVYLHRFLDDVVTQLNHALAGRNVTLKVEAEYKGTAYFDEQKIMRLLHNLARNAADAMPEGGEFRVTASEDDSAEPPLLVFEVADNGPGIPVELEGKLFEMFATAKQGGTGLGLAIVKKIVDEHDGAITYESRRGEGTTFTIRIPRDRPEARQGVTVEDSTAH
ncbi:MAG: GAF domain-containing protein [Myxococcota bacterium]